ncbi:MAG: ATP-dependent Clp protease ATP-binding subunit [Acidobacteria bacterium]|nr:ATP-dependent Clp protease ATP-binding subunit [Acidobacteriota bacterium]
MVTAVKKSTTKRTLLDPSRTGREAADLERRLRKLVVGQEDAVQQIVHVYQTYLAGMNPVGRPVGNFLFLGPTGTGKTRVVEATAESLVGDQRAVIKIDCAEFQHSHEIAKLIGSPPGYLGHRETHPLLSQEAINQFHSDRIKISFVLFDEIEKASDSLWNLLLGILDKATLTLGDNRRVDFSQCLIFLLNDTGTTEMEDALTQGLGFAGRNAVDAEAPQTVQRLHRAGIRAARRKFTPEFVNRLDKIVVFRPLSEDDLRQILRLELLRVQERIFTGTPFLFQLTDAAKDFLLTEGADAKYGARHLKRAIERALVHPMANLITTGQVRSGDLVSVDFDREESRMTFERVDEGLPVYTMFRAAGIQAPSEIIEGGRNRTA